MRLGRTMTALLGFLIAFQIGCASVGEPNIEALVSSESSSADHREIAAYYREKAAEMRELSAMHRRLAEVYGDRLNWGVAFAVYQSEHCKKLADTQEQVAIGYEYLAAQHEILAGR